MITAIIIAAGLSKRMGSNKALLKYKGVTFTTGITLKLLKICSNVIIVLGYEHNIVKKVISDELNSVGIYLKNIKFIVNNDYEKGMFSSLQAGIKEMGNTEWYLYHFVDQPQIPENFYEQIKVQIDSEFNWIQPIYNKRKGHPVVFDSLIAEAIVNSPNNFNLKDLVHSGNYAKKYFESWEPSVLQDIDYNSDYENILNKK